MAKIGLQLLNKKLISRAILCALVFLTHSASALEVGPNWKDQWLNRWVQIKLDRPNESSVIQGQVISVYHHVHWWWDPEEKTTIALFTPNKAKLRFLSATEISSIEEAPAQELSFQEFSIRSGLTLERSPLLGDFSIIMGNEGYHLEENGYGDFAYDFTRLNASENRFNNSGLKNEDYGIWGADVVAPLSGQIVELVRTEIDQTPGAYRDRSQSNLIGIGIGGPYVLYLLHLQHGSIPDSLQVGSWVTTGQPLGRVGNNGVSLEPHLHMSLLAWDEEATPAPRYWSVPLKLTEATCPF